jgi:hypothetical protein
MADSKERRPIDYAPTTEDAWAMCHFYVKVKNRLGLKDYAIGVDPDPVPTPDGHHVYVVYAVAKPKIPEQQKPAE